MKKLFILSVLALGQCSVIADGQEFKYHLVNSFVTKYLASMGMIVSDKPSLVNDVTVSKGNFYAGVWVAIGIGHGAYGKTYKDDWDPYIGWTHSFGVVRYEITGIYFLVADFSRMNDDLWCVDQKISLPKCPIVQPYLKVRGMDRVGQKSTEGGWFTWIGIERNQPIGKAKLNVDLSTAYSDGPLGKDPGLVFSRITSSLSVPLSDSMNITSSIYYQIPASFQKHAQSSIVRKDELIWGISVGYSMGSKNTKK